jgi:hypothetical protein
MGAGNDGNLAQYREHAIDTKMLGEGAEHRLAPGKALRHEPDHAI